MTATNTINVCQNVLDASANRRDLRGRFRIENYLSRSFQWYCEGVSSLLQLAKYFDSSRMKYAEKYTLFLLNHRRKICNLKTLYEVVMRMNFSRNIKYVINHFLRFEKGQKNNWSFFPAETNAEKQLSILRQQKNKLTFFSPSEKGSKNNYPFFRQQKAVQKNKQVFEYYSMFNVICYVQYYLSIVNIISISQCIV